MLGWSPPPAAANAALDQLAATPPPGLAVARTSGLGMPPPVLDPATLRTRNNARAAEIARR